MTIRLLLVAALAAGATAAYADPFAPCEPEDVQCHRNCAPYVVLNEGIKNVRIEYVAC